MSTISVNSIVLATMGLSGTSALTSIEIDVSALAFNSQANIVVVTFDSRVNASVTAGSFAKHSSAAQPTTPWGTPQTAMVLVSEGAIKSSKITIGLEPALVSPVRWRAIGVAIAGPLSRSTLNEIVGVGAVWEEGFVPLPETSGSDKSVYIGFFASGTPAPTVPTASVVQKGQMVDGINKITCYAWNEDPYTAGGSGQGPWFYAALQVSWKTVTYRPPATESDDFWAAPAACDAADVLIINNNSAASYWDIPEVNVGGEPDTLLLNYTDSDGTRWMMNDMEGWWTLPPPALPDLPRPGYLDGSFPVDGRYEPRIVVLRGTFWPGTGISVAKPRLRLLRSLDAVRNGALLVVKEPMGYNAELITDDPAVTEWDQGPWPKQSWVWLSDQPKVNTLDMTGRTEFEVQLKAVDPVKYLSGANGMNRKYVDWSGANDGRDYSTGEVWSAYRGQRYTPAPGRAYGYVDYLVSLPATNKGTANISPRIFIYGPVSDPKVVNLTTDQMMAFQGTVQAGEVLIVDCYWRTVVMRSADEVVIDDTYQNDINGLNKRWMLKLSSPWIYMQPGENDFQFYGNGTDVATNPPGLDDVNKTQCWLVYRSGWTGS